MLWLGVFCSWYGLGLSPTSLMAIVHIVLHHSLHPTSARNKSHTKQNSSSQAFDLFIYQPSSNHALLHSSSHTVHEPNRAIREE